MGGLSLTHLLLLIAVLAIFFGPSRLPNLGRSIGEAIRGFKKGLDGGDEPSAQEKLPQGEGTHRSEVKDEHKNKV